MDMNNIVLDEQRERRINIVLKKVGFVEQQRFTQEATWFGLNLRHALDLTAASPDGKPMDLSDERVQAKCEMLLDLQKPTLLIGESRCGESGELATSLKSLRFAFKLYE